ncbi:MAG: hypothetical protein KDC54_07730, partial [Lewinella sp.]|nr:hypothetical protein [Lewinella sp.]
DGWGGNIVNSVKTVNQIFSSSLSPEEKINNVIGIWAPGAVIGQIEDDGQRAAVAGAYSFMEAWLDEPENEDLIRLSAICLSMRLNEERKPIVEPLKGYVHFYPKYTFSVAAMHPLQTTVYSYRGQAFDEGSGSPSTYADLGNSHWRPLSVHLQNRWTIMTDDSELGDLGAFIGLELMGRQSPILYRSQADGFFTPGTGVAYRQAGLEGIVGLRPFGGFRKVGFDLGFSMGGLACFRADVKYPGPEPATDSELVIGAFEYDFTGLTIGLHARLDLSVLILQGSYRVIAANAYKDEFDEDYYAQHSIELGVAVPLVRGYERL